MEKDSDTEPGSLKNKNVDLHDAHRDSLEGSVADLVKDRKGNVVQIQDFGEASHPIQAQPDQAALPTSQWKNQGDNTNSTLSTSRFPPLSYSGKEVSRTPKKKFEEFRKVVMAEGNSEAKQFICAVADFLGEIEQEKDYKYNLLVLQNGLLISLCEVTKDKNYRSRVMIEQRSRENGMFWLYATLSEDNVVTYKKGREFRIMYPALGRGAEGTVYTAMDNGGSGVFAVKQMSLKAFCEKKTNLSAFLRLAGCEHICSPYGVLLDEEEKCVFFLMEKLKGETLKRFFDRGERIGVRKAVGYAVQFMKALRYIHSKRMVYTDVKASNVILDGSDAIAIDITGVKSPSNKQYYYYSLLDAINAISLLNKMLLEPEKRNSETSQTWKPSAADRNSFDSDILDRLENLVSEHYGTSDVEKPLKDLQEILKELPETPTDVQQEVVSYQEEQQDTTSKMGFTPLGLTQPGYSSREDPEGQQEPHPEHQQVQENTSGSETSPLGCIPSPYHLTSSSESKKGQSAQQEREPNKQTEAQKEMQKPTESLEEEREILKYLKKLNEANKEIEERDKMLAELKADKEKEEIEIKNLRQEFNRVNKKRIDSEEGAKKKIGEQEKMISKLLHENQQLKQTENEYKNLQGIFETLKESRKELKSKVEHLEAEIQRMQEREKEWEVEIDASKAEVQREKETTEKAEQGAKQQQDKLNAEVQIEKEKRKEAQKNAEQLRIELEALKAQNDREVQERADRGGEPNQSLPPQGYEPDKLFVVGLSWGTSEASLCQAFSRFGTVTECKVIRDHRTGRSRRFGFVKFSALSEADAARKDMHFQHLDGRTIRVDYAKYRFGSAASNERYTCRNYSGLSRSHYNSGRSSYYNSGYVRDSYYGHRGGNYHDNYRSYYSDEYESNHGGGDY